MVPAAYVRLDALSAHAERQGGPQGAPRARRRRVRRARRTRRPSGEAEQARGGDLGGAAGRRSGWAAATTSSSWAGTRCWRVRVVSRVRQALGVERVARRPVRAARAGGLRARAGDGARGRRRPAIVPRGPLRAHPALVRAAAAVVPGAAGQPGQHVPHPHRACGCRARWTADALVARAGPHRRPPRGAAHDLPGGGRRAGAADRAGGGERVRAWWSTTSARRRMRRRSCTGCCADEADAPFDLAHGPLIRGRLVRMAADDHVLLVTMHHIVSDGWSMGVLLRELGALYAAFVRRRGRSARRRCRSSTPTTRPGSAAWVEGERAGGAGRATGSGRSRARRSCWSCPTDRARPAKQDFAGASLDVELDEALTAALRALSQRHGATLFMTLLAGWAAVLARLSGQDDVVIGTPSGEPGQGEVEELIGFFVNTLAAARGPVGRAHRGGAAGAGAGAGAGGAAAPGHPLRAGGGAGAAGAQPGAHARSSR